MKRIFSADGGGIRDSSVAETSTGGLIALAITAGQSAETILTVYSGQAGKEIFHVPEITAGSVSGHSWYFVQERSKSAKTVGGAPLVPRAGASAAAHNPNKVNPPSGFVPTLSWMQQEDAKMDWKKGLEM